KEDFEKILNGEMPDGEKVGQVEGRRLGVDLTFSMPKSASVMAYVACDTRVLTAHMNAVKATMGWVEKTFAEGRTYDQSRSGDAVRTGNLVYALFQHDTSRALDPQGHVHAVIANLTRLPNGQWQSLWNGEIWRNNTVTSSVYHAALRDALTKLGYQVELQGKHGTFEIAGVPKAIREAFSQRREAILEKATELGTLTPKGMDKITTNTRDAKTNVKDREVLRDSWIDKAEVLGWSPQPLIEEAKQREAHQPGLIERGIIAIETTFRDASAYVAEHLRGQTDPLIDKGLDRLRLSPEEATTQVAVASAIRILSQREAAFEIHQLAKTALDLGLRDVKPDGIARRVTELIKAEQLVPGVSERLDNAVTMVTTRDALETETAILKQVDAGKGSSPPAMTTDLANSRIGAAAGDRPLNGDQLTAALSILSSDDRIIAIQGDAGTGKSTMLKPVADVLASEGKRVLGLGFQTTIANALREESGIEAMTVARFVMQHQGAVDGDRAGISKARNELGGAYLVLDEGSLVANNQMLSVLKIANAAGVDRLVMIGDRKQLLPIDAGKSFALVQAGGIATTRMEQNLRQRTPELQAAAALSKAGKTGDALRLLGNTT
ncbi:MAG: conjugative relaxase, partial [Verrucomicrobia bacterium]|nr:conjugative relaxase [Verrucomicrobiota bacterium]